MANTTGIKFGGRKPGTPNKENAPMREKFNQLLNNYSIEQMTHDLHSIDDPVERLKIIIGLAEFIMPKMARVTHEGGDSPVQFQISLDLG